MKRWDVDRGNMKLLLAAGCHCGIGRLADTPDHHLKIIIQVEAVRPIRLQRVTGARVAKPHPLPSSHRPTSNSQSRAITDRAVSGGLVAGHTI